MPSQLTDTRIVSVSCVPPAAGVARVGEDLERHATLIFPELRAERRIILNQAREYHQRQGWRSESMESHLMQAFRLSCSRSDLDILSASMQQAMGKSIHLTPFLFTFCKLIADTRLQEQLTPQTIVQCAEAMNQLRQVRPVPDRLAVARFLDEVGELLPTGVTPQQLDIFLRLTVAAIKESPYDSRYCFDFTGETRETFDRLLRINHTDKELAELAMLLEQHKNFPSSLRQIVRISIEGIQLPDDREVRAHLNRELDGDSEHRAFLLRQHSIAILNAIVHLGDSGVRPVANAFSELLSINPSDQSVEIFCNSVKVLPRSSFVTSLKELVEICQLTDQLPIRPQFLSNYLRAIESSMITDWPAAREELRRLFANEALEILSFSGHPQGSAAQRLYYRFSDELLGDLSAPNALIQAWGVPDTVESVDVWFRNYRQTQRGLATTDAEGKPRPERLLIDPEQLAIRHRLVDKVNGFGTLLFPSRRTPTRAPAELLRFGHDLGTVSYLNASSANEFPGKGFIIEKLKLDKIFVKDPDQPRTPYAAYMAAWPNLAKDLHLLQYFRFIFSRGVMALSCDDKGAIFSLRYPDGTHHRVGLLGFNDHFKNPKSRGAYVAPLAAIDEWFLPSRVGYDDFTGFKPGLPDLVKTIPSPDALLNDPRWSKYIIELTDPIAVRAGFGKLRPEFQFPESDERRVNRYRQELAAYHERKRAWDQRSHTYHISPLGSLDYRGIEAEHARLQKEHREIDAETKRRVAQTALLVAGGRTAGDKAWPLVERFMNVVDVFSISLSYWRRGYTQGDIVRRYSIEDSDQMFDQPIQDQPLELRVSRDESVQWNQNAIRMLAMAYEWHAQHQLGIEDRSLYPVLVLTDAFSWGSITDSKVRIDTYDMTVRIGEQTVQLNQAGMDADDELFWHTTVMQAVQDAPGRIFDLRPLSRESISR